MLLIDRSKKTEVEGAMMPKIGLKLAFRITPLMGILVCGLEGVAHAEGVGANCLPEGKYYAAIGRTVLTLPYDHRYPPISSPRPGDPVAPDASAPVGCYGNPVRYPSLAPLGWIAPELRLGREPGANPEDIRVLFYNIGRLHSAEYETEKVRPRICASQTSEHLNSAGYSLCVHAAEGGVFTIPEVLYTLNVDQAHAFDNKQISFYCGAAIPKSEMASLCLLGFSVDTEFWADVVFSRPITYTPENIVASVEHLIVKTQVFYAERHVFDYDWHAKAAVQGRPSQP
jgi:hypothetical protein